MSMFVLKGLVGSNTRCALEWLSVKADFSLSYCVRQGKLDLSMAQSDGNNRFIENFEVIQTLGNHSKKVAQLKTHSQSNSYFKHL